MLTSDSVDTGREGAGIFHPPWRRLQHEVA